MQKEDKNNIPTLSINAINQLHFSSNLDVSSNVLINPEEFLVQRLEDLVASINRPIHHIEKQFTILYSSMGADLANFWHD